jgi:hypothetical protein
MSEYVKLFIDAFVAAFIGAFVAGALAVKKAAKEFLGRPPIPPTDTEAQKSKRS